MICIYQSRYLGKVGTRPIAAVWALNGYHSIVGMDHPVVNPREGGCGFLSSLSAEQLHLLAQAEILLFFSEH